jgi:hypothetical protein
MDHGGKEITSKIDIIYICHFLVCICSLGGKGNDIANVWGQMSKGSSMES